MPENTYDPSLSLQPLGMAGGVIDDDEWNKIQAAADQIAQEATRAGIPSQPDDPEDRTALEKRAVDEQVANIQRAHLWVPPQVTREHQDNSDVLQALDDMASEYVDQKMRHSAHWKLKAAMNKRGIDIRGKWRYHRLIREALARADQSFGRMWDKVLDPGRTKKLLANAILQTVAEETKLSALNRYGPGEWDTVWQVQQGTMRRPDLVKDARDFYNLMQNFKAYKQYVDEEGYYDPQAYRGAHHNRDEVVRLYWAVTGQAVPRAGYPTQWHGNVFPVLHGFAKGTDWAQQTARAVVPLQIMGVKVGPEHVDQEGVIPAGVFPQYEKEMATYGAMLATGYSMTDPESMAEFKTLAEAEDKIRHTPGAFLKELTGRPQPAAAAYLEQFPNPNTRWTKFFQLINPDRRGVIESSTPGVRRIIPPINAISNYKQWAAKRHAFWLEQQQNIPHNLAEHVDASITDDDLRFLRQAVLAERNKHWDRIKNNSKEFLRTHNVPFRFMTWLANSLGSIDHAIGIGEVSGKLTVPLGEFIMDRYLDPLPGDEILVGERNIGAHYVIAKPERDIGHWLGRNTLGYTPDYAWAHMKARLDMRKANWADDLAVGMFALRDFFADLPGALFHNPLGMYLLGRVAGQYGKLARRGLERMRQAGVPRPIVALAHFAAEPLRPVSALNELFGVSPQLVRHLRSDVRAWKKAMNRAAKNAPHILEAEQAKVEAYLDRAEKSGVAPSDAIRNVRALYGNGIAKLKRGETLGWYEVDRILKSTLPLPADLARNILPAPLATPTPLRNKLVGMWEAEQTMVEIEKLDMASTNQLKEMTGRTLAEHVGEAWQAWYSRPDVFMPKRQAFYQLLERLPWSPERRAMIRSAYDKMVDTERNLPAAAAEFRDALVSLKKQQGEFMEHAELYSGAAETQRLEVQRLDTEIEVAAVRLRAIDQRIEYLAPKNLRRVQAQEELVRTQLEKQLGVKAPGPITAEGLRGIRQQLETLRGETVQKIDNLRAARGVAEENANRLTGAASDLDLLREQGMIGATQPRGAERGYKPQFNRNLRNRVARDTIVITIDAVGHVDAVRYGIPKRFVEVDRTAADNATAQGLELVKRGKMQSEMLADFVRRRRVRALASAQHWTIEPIAEYYAKRLEAQRHITTAWESMLRADDVRYGIFDIARMDKFPTLKGAHLNEIIQGLAAAGHPFQNMAARMNRDYWHRLSPRDMETLKRGLDDPTYFEKHPRAAAHVQSMWFDLEGYRALVLEESFKAGKISRKDYEKYIAEAYVERHYPDMIWDREMQELGFQPRAGYAKTAEGIPEIRPARFEHYRAQRSSQYARVFYTDRKTGEPLEHWESVEKHGSPAAADRAAQAWANEQLKTGVLNKEHIVQWNDTKQPHVLKVMTDQELGGLGVIDNNGMFRVETLEKIMRDNLRMRFLNHVGLIGGLVRSPRQIGKRTVPEGVAQQHHAEWTEPLRGKQWGLLQGKMIHRSLVRAINTMDHYGDMLEGMRDAWLAEVKQMKFMTGMDKALTFRFREVDHPAARWADDIVKGVYHNYIVKNWETWVTNHVGNWFSFALAGLNPVSPATLRELYTFRQIHRAVVEADLVKVGGPAGLWRFLEKKFSSEEVQAYRLLYDRNLLAPTVGSEIGALGTGGTQIKGVLREILTEHDNRIKAARGKLEEVLKAKELIQEELRAYADPEVPKADKLTRSQAEEAELRLKRLNALTKRYRAEAAGSLSSNPFWSWLRRKPEAYLRETVAFAARGNRSIVGRWLSEEYGKIDAMYKYAAFRRLIQKGLTPDQALAEIGDFFQNYNKVPGWVKGLKAAPLLGPMVPSFAYEAGRILKNAFTKNPGRALAVYNTPMVWNLAALASRGMSVNDFLITDTSENRAQAYTKLWTRLFIPGPDSMNQLYLGKYTYTNILENPNGAYRILGREVQTRLDQIFGPLPAAIMSGVLNWFSNFWLANPFFDATEELATGVDSFNREITYGKGIQASPLKAIGGKLLEFITPRTITAAYEELRESHEESQITGHQRTQLQSAVRLITGMSLTRRKDTEAIGVLALRYGRMEQMVDALKSQKSNDQVALKESAVRARRAWEAGELEEYKKELAKVAKLIAKHKDRLIYHSGQWIKLRQTPEEIAEQAISYAARDIHTAIERVPIDRMPDFYAEVMLSGYERAKPELTNHIWRQMGDFWFAQRIQDVPKLRVAVEKLYQKETQLRGNPELKAKFEQARQMLQLRLAQLEPKAAPAIQALLQRVAALQAQLKNDPAGFRRAMQKVLLAEDKALRKVLQLP